MYSVAIMSYKTFVYEAVGMQIPFRRCMGTLCCVAARGDDPMSYWCNRYYTLQLYVTQPSPPTRLGTFFKRSQVLMRRSLKAEGFWVGGSCTLISQSIVVGSSSQGRRRASFA